MISATIEPTELPIGHTRQVRLRLQNCGEATVTGLVLRLSFPAGIVLVEGPSRLELPRLLPGQVHDTDLRVLAEVLGPTHVTSGNFSYRDGWGRAQRVTGWSCGLEVVSGIPASEGRLRIDNTRMSCDLWDALDGVFENTGAVGLARVRIELQGPALESTPVELGHVSAGERTPVRFNVRARQAGVVPITIVMTGTDDHARDFTLRQPAEMNVGIRTQPSEMNVGARGMRRSILFLAAQPDKSEVLRLGRELKVIRAKLALGDPHECLELKDRQAVRRSELSRELLTTCAQIVHFSGHATPRGELCFEGEDGGPEPAAPQAVAALFSLLDEPIECVVLNSCFTDGLADALSPHVRYVIGASGGLDDEAAFAFSSGFYQALALGKTIERAFALASAEVHLAPELSSQAFVLRVRESTATAPASPMASL